MDNQQESVHDWTGGPAPQTIPVKPEPGKVYNYRLAERRSRAALVAKEIFMVPGYEVIRDPMDPRLYAPNKKIVNPQDTKVVELTKTLVGHHIIEGGLGLAGPQIGWNAQVFCARNPNGEGTVVFYNTRIHGTWRLKEESLDEELINWEQEGCISHPGVFASVCRLRRIKFTAMTYSHPYERVYDTTGMFARVVQHEYHHSMPSGGKLFLDLGPLVKDMVIDPVGQAELQEINRLAAEKETPKVEV